MALAEEMRIPQAEVYEVATFYAHFDVVKEGGSPPPPLTVRVCDSLSCELAGAGDLHAELTARLESNAVRVLRAPCMGRCATAPVCEVGHRHVDEATGDSVEAMVIAREVEPLVPAYRDYEAYVAEGGYALLEPGRAQVGVRAPRVRPALLRSQR